MTLFIYRRTEVIYIIVTAFVLLATLYSMIVPQYEVPDEPGHVSYILYLREHRKLPIQKTNITDSAHHPPLYYLIAAIMSLPADLTDRTGAYQVNPKLEWETSNWNAVNIAEHHSAETFPYHGHALFLHLSRLTSILMGAATVVVVFLIGRKIFPENLEISGLAATLVAFNPQFLFISGAVNNDNLLALASTTLCYHVICAMQQSRKDAYVTKHWLLAGLWLNVATLAKVNGLLFLGLIGLFLLIYAWQRHSPIIFFKYGSMIAFTTLTLSGWWFVRNWMLYGDFLGWSAFNENFSNVMRQTPLQINDVRYFFSTQFNSFWGRFGWMNVWSPAWFYMWMRWLQIIAVTGLAIFTFGKGRKLLSSHRISLLVLIVMALMGEGYMLWAITKFDSSWYQGRYIFPLIAPLMIYMSIGLLSWVVQRFQAFVCLLLAIIMCSIALYMPFYVIQPAYKITPQAKWRTWFLQNKTAYQFGDSIQLLGYETAYEDSKLVVNLYLQAIDKPDFNYSSFVHLLNEDDIILTQDDHAPGEPVGYPPLVWAQGDIVIGRYQLDLTEVELPSSYRLRMGFYNWETGQRLAVESGDNVISDYIILRSK